MTYFSTRQILHRQLRPCEPTFVIRCLAVGALALLLSACGPESRSVDGAQYAAPAADERPWVLPLHAFAPEEAPIFWEDEDELRLTDEGVYRLFAEHEGIIELGELEIWHVGLRIDAEALDTLRVAGRQLDGAWTEEAPLEISWQEGYAHVAHAFFEAPVTAIRLVPGEARIAFALIDFFDSPPPAAPGSGEQGEPAHSPGEDPDFGGPEGGPDFEIPDAGPGAPSARPPEGDGPLGTPKSSLIPPGGVPRADWGAAAAGCSYSAHTVSRLTVHHTATPNQDSITAPARMRQMQSYHMGPNLGWCDLGYHYVIGFDGNLYQGAGTPDRLGTHVGGQNTGNLGISLMGTFVSVAPSAGMIEELEHVLCWSAERYATTLPRNRTAIRGHNEWPGHASNACPGTQLRNQLDGLVAGICTPTCTDACSGGARCVSETERETCADHNGDGCNDWGGRSACGAAERCEGAGECVVIPEPSSSSAPPVEPSEPSEPAPGSGEPGTTGEPGGSESGAGSQGGGEGSGPGEGSAGAGSAGGASGTESPSAGGTSASEVGSAVGGANAGASGTGASAGASGSASAASSEAAPRAPGERRGEPGQRVGDPPEVVTTGCSAADLGGAGSGRGGGALWGSFLVLLVVGRRRGR